MNNGPVSPVLFSALAFLGATLGSAWLARTPSDLAHAGAVLLAATGLLATAALTPARTFSRPALLGAGGILALCMALPLPFVASPSAWIREIPGMLGYVWMWMFCLGLPYPRSRAWCVSTPTLLAAAALLGGGVVASALW